MLAVTEVLSCGFLCFAHKQAQYAKTCLAAGAAKSLKIVKVALTCQSGFFSFFCFVLFFKCEGLLIDTG